MEYDLKKIFDMTISLMGKSNIKELLDRILTLGMDISNSDAGTLYIEKDGMLEFYIMRNNSMNVYLGLKEKIDLPKIEIDESTVSGYVAKNKVAINIKDVYNDKSFNWDGPKRYDKLTGYRTKSQLVLPLIDNQERLIGVMQLINSMDKKGNIIEYNTDVEYIIYSLASITAMLLSNRILIDEIQKVLDSFVKSMTTAIDSRTPYNADHTINVAKLCGDFCKYLNENTIIHINSDDSEELVMAAYLHDIGKIIVPLNILNKSDRLDTKINDITYKSKLILDSLEIRYLKNEIDNIEYGKERSYIYEAMEFINELNKRAYLTEADEIRVKEIGEKKYNTSYGTMSLLEGSELDSMLIRKGTLTQSERKEVEKHVVYTNRILHDIDFGRKYKNVLRLASNHHEYLNGTGYPNHLRAEDLSLRERILTIMDIYDSLTSRDRPYKKPVSKDKAYLILKEMASEGKLDDTLVNYMKGFLGL